MANQPKYTATQTENNQKSREANNVTAAMERQTQETAAKKMVAMNHP